MNRKIGFIGTGNMGGALLRGYLSSAGAKAEDVYICRKNPEKLQAMADELGVNPCHSTEELVETCDVVFIGVKPNMFPEIMPKVGSAYCEGKVIVSMAAGKTMDEMERLMEEGSGRNLKKKIIRIMPNTPAMVGEGMISLSKNANIEDADLSPVLEILGSSGKVEEVPEDLIHCVIGVSGSSPAYTYMYIDALIKAAVKNGMEYESAKVFAAQSVLGAAKMVMESSQPPEQLRINVCSPGGTTIEAVGSLTANNFEQIVMQGFQAAVDKSVAMSR